MLAPDPFPPDPPPCQQVYLAQWHQETQVAVKVLLSGMGASLATADDMQRALTLSSPMLDKLEEVSCAELGRAGWVALCSPCWLEPGSAAQPGWVAWKSCSASNECGGLQGWVAGSVCADCGRPCAAC